ncbi:threonine synthase [Pontibacter chinhatensis]|uniref:Threonine synthase n=1 Tax=Pontibacter chinhatensis TaxID=1436961 RepID=A0A1I2PH33_9BACT|nr:threonine synthase [Pontibacter chinhatensis]SFG14860.1 threonine synthase [Pontibacter chinhatensis]
MLYSSTSRLTTHVPLEKAVLKGLADDGGLYMPASVPVLPPAFLESLHQLSLQEIAYTVASAFLQEDVPAQVLKSLVEEVLNFEIPLVKVEKDIYSLELFHGPTMAFKDVGARFMSRLMAYFTRGKNEALKVIVATSGDTGSAVAAGFHQVQGIQVYILYPKGKVSPLQQKQLTTWGDNITAIEVEGTFDDCQRLAKQALADQELNQRHLLTSANSINIARLIPQSFYYFYAYGQLQQQDKPIVFSVPSGNFGNLTGGLLAAAMGLPVHRFIAATNANDVVPQYLQTGVYAPKPSVQTISNAMDVGSPSNYARMEALFSGELEQFRRRIAGYTFTDEETQKTIREVYQRNGYLLDPHGAVAFSGARKLLSQTKEPTIAVFLETAHPAKFREVMEDTLGEAIAIPAKLQRFAEKQEHIVPMQNSFEELKSILSEV